MIKSIHFTGQYSGHKSCFFPHPRGRGDLFSSPIFRSGGPKMSIIMAKIGAKRRNFRVLPSQKLQNDLNWEEISKNAEEIWEIWKGYP